MSTKSYAGVFNSKTKFINISRERTGKQLGNITVNERDITDNRT